MSIITEHIGKKIKLYRKINGLTLEQLAHKINKSTATLSKYESGQISCDVETLFLLSDHLGCEFAQLTDYSNKHLQNNHHYSKKTIFGETDKLYMYLFDGRIKKIVKSIVTIEYNQDSSSYKSTLYMNVENFSEFHKCEHLYVGEFYPYDMVSNFVLVNQINPVEFMNIIIINPLNYTKSIKGLLSGISGYPFMPAASKVLFSTDNFKNSEDIIEQLLFSKEDLRSIKKYNFFTFVR